MEDPVAVPQEAAEAGPLDEFALTLAGHLEARLWDVAPLIPPGQRWSRVNSGRRELIDHVLLSHRLVHRATAAGTGLPGEGPPGLPSVGPDPAERRGEPGSDHAPVWVRLGG